jgi:hypothetical protein
MLSPPKLPASQVTPGAQKPILATRRRSLQMVLRLLAAAAGHWLGNRLNDYLRDPDEYRAITRRLLHLGGTITSTPRVITVTLDPRPRPGSPAPLPCSSRRSTQPRPACPATPGKSPTISRRTLEFNNDQGPTSGGLSLGELIEHWNWRLREAKTAPPSSQPYLRSRTRR